MLEAPNAQGRFQPLDPPSQRRLGIRLLVHSGRPRPGPGPTSPPPGLARALAQGAVANLANPKSLLFYASVFVGGVPAGASPATLALLLLNVGLIGLGWSGGLVMALSRPAVAAAFLRRRGLIERSCGLLLLALALLPWMPN